jgi:hypothetical protein
MNVRVWVGYSWFMKERCCAILWSHYWTFRLSERRGISWVAERLLDFAQWSYMTSLSFNSLLENRNQYAASRINFFCKYSLVYTWLHVAFLLSCPSVLWLQVSFLIITCFDLQREFWLSASCASVSWLPNLFETFTKLILPSWAAP